jgi:hypothetical protein
MSISAFKYCNKLVANASHLKGGDVLDVLPRDRLALIRIVCVSHVSFLEVDRSL